MNIRIRKRQLYPHLIAALILLPCLTDGADEATLRLANDLAREENHPAAAIEYRRLALAEPEPTRRAGYYWAAAYQYHHGGKHQLAEKMLDRAEDESNNLAAEALLLRSEISRATGDNDQAEFYLGSAIKKQTTAAAGRLMAKRLAMVRLIKNDPDGAKRALQGRPATEELAAIASFESGSARSPVLGGILGLVPGMGYAYSGEYANALRSLARLHSIRAS